MDFDIDIGEVEVLCWFFFVFVYECYDCCGVWWFKDRYIYLFLIFWIDVFDECGGDGSDFVIVGFERNFEIGDIFCVDVVDENFD